MGRDREKDTKRRPMRASDKIPLKKVTPLLKPDVKVVDYKDVNLLRKFVSDRGKIRARRVTGACTQHQRSVATAVKNSREVALLPYTSTAR